MKSTRLSSVVALLLVAAPATLFFACASNSSGDDDTSDTVPTKKDAGKDAKSTISTTGSGGSDNGTAGDDTTGSGGSNSTGSGGSTTGSGGSTTGSGGSTTGSGGSTAGSGGSTTGSGGSTSDSGTDATSDAASDTSSGTGGSDGGTDASDSGTTFVQVDASRPAGGCRSDMVKVPTSDGNGSYCIDADEVTNLQYQTFLEANVPLSQQPPACSGNTTFTPGPTSGTPAWPRDAGTSSQPVGYVDWCDAYAYCFWNKKHLCGAIGGGAIAPASFTDKTQDEWYNACSKGGTQAYPYGNTFNANTCNATGAQSDGQVNVGSKTSCVGGYPGIYDMSGNQYEWENSCDGNSGDSDHCRRRGGSWFNTAAGDLACDVDRIDSQRNAQFGNLGFRCCDEVGETADGGTDASSDVSATDATSNDVSTDTTSVDVNQGSCPAGMVSVPVNGGSPFCIDSTEVTNAAYMAWLDFNPSTSGRPAECSWNSDFTPNGGQPARDSLPVSNVDWCDAQAYCHDADKHLCGAVGGGSIGYSQYLSGFTSEWYIACSAGGAHQYPYGDTLSNGTCADTNASVAVGTKSGCVGGYAGIYDMSGNVAEWIDSCQPNTFDGGAGADSCRILGGSFSPVTGNLTCGDDKGINRNTTAGAVGFRCCK